jgi:DNA-binding transcriptional ArsR family regulator
MQTAFEALVEPNRRRILDLLREEERTVGELVEHLSLSQPAVSKHLRVLRDAGLVTARVDAQRRRYRVRPAPLAEVDATTGGAAVQQADEAIKPVNLHGPTPLSGACQDSARHPSSGEYVPLAKGRFFA